MRMTRRTKLNLISLENRVTPNASVSFSSGFLTVTTDTTATSVFITNSDSNSLGAVPGQGYRVFVVQGNQFGALSSAGGDPAQFETAANLRFFTTSPITRLTVNGGNSADVFWLTQQDGTSFPGAVYASMGNSNDDIQFQTRTNGNATIQGLVTLNGGLGADNFFIFDTDIQGITQVVGGGSGFRQQGAFMVPGDVIDMSDSNVNNLMVATGCITLVDSGYGPNTIDQLIVSNGTVEPLGNFRTIDGTAYPAGAVPGSPGTYSGLLVLDAGSVIEGNLTYVGSGSNDGVYIRGTVTGKVTVTSPGGTDDFFLGDRGNPGTVNGDVSFYSGTGVDRVDVDSNSVVNGSVQLYMGDGDNIYDLSNPFTIDGNFRLYAGNGTDNVGSIAGFIGGTQYYNPGNGTNTVVWNGTSGGTRFDYFGGGGSDFVTLNGVNSFSVFAYLNAGDDQLAFGNNSTFADIRADGGPGNDGLHQGLNMVFTSFSAINFEYGF